MNWLDRIRVVRGKNYAVAPLVDSLCVEEDFSEIGSESRFQAATEYRLSLELQSSVRVLDWADYTCAIDDTKRGMVRYIRQDFAEPIQQLDELCYGLARIAGYDPAAKDIVEDMKTVISRMISMTRGDI